MDESKKRIIKEGLEARNIKLAWDDPERPKSHPAWFLRTVQEDSSYLEGKLKIDDFFKIVDIRRDLAAFVHAVALPMITENLEQIRQELNDPAIKAEEIFSLYDLIFFGFSAIPRKLAGDSPTFAKILEQSFDLYKEQNPDATDASSILEEISYVPILPENMIIADSSMETSALPQLRSGKAKAVSVKGKDGTMNIVSIEGADDASIARFKNRPYPLFDIFVEGAIASYGLANMKNGQYIATPETLYRTWAELPPGATVTDEEIELVKDAVEYMNTQPFTYDFSQELMAAYEKKGKPLDQDKLAQATIRGTMIHKDDIVVDYAGHTILAYRFFGLPLFARHALETNTYRKYKTEYLNPPRISKNRKYGNTSFIRANINHYIMREICRMIADQHRKEPNYKRTIYFQTMLEDITPGKEYSRTEIKRYRDYVLEHLKYLKENNAIKDFKIIEGPRGAKIGVKISVSKKNSTTGEIEQEEQGEEE